MRKIAIITSDPFSIGGLQRITINYVNMMADYYLVDLICVDLHTVPKDSTYNLDPRVNVIVDRKISHELTANIFIKSLRYINRKFLGIKNINFLEFLYTNFDEFKYLIEFINNNGYHAVVGIQLKLSILLGVIASKINCKTIGWQHNTYEAYFRIKGNYYWNQDKLASKYLNNLSACIVLTDDIAKKYAQKLSVNAKRIYNPSSMGYSSYSEIQKFSDSYILWVGRIIQVQKGTDILVKIALELKKIISDYKLYIVGDGPDMLKLRTEIDRQDLKENIVVCGSTTDIENYYKKASMLISTSRWEGFGLNVIEAMSFGLPVIAFENSGPNEIIGNSNGGILVSKYDEKEFAEKIGQVLLDDQLRTSMSKAAFKRAQDFKPPIIVKEWFDILGGS